MTRRDFGNVRRLESGRFQARYVDRNGRRRTASFDTERLAVEHLAEAQADLGRGRWQDPTIARRRFGEHAQAWLDSRVDLEPTTRQQYGGTLRRHVLPHLGGCALEELTSARVRSCYAPHGAVRALRCGRRVFLPLGGPGLADPRLDRWAVTLGVCARGLRS